MLHVVVLRDDQCVPFGVRVIFAAVPAEIDYETKGKPRLSALWLATVKRLSCGFRIASVNPKQPQENFLSELRDVLGIAAG
jgi:hypothetical protein